MRLLRIELEVQDRASSRFSMTTQSISPAIRDGVVSLDEVLAMAVDLQRSRRNAGARTQLAHGFD